MSTIYLSEKKEYRALDFSKFVAAFLVAAIHIPPFEESCTGIFTRISAGDLPYGSSVLFCVHRLFSRGKNNRQRQGKKISFPYYKDVCMVESVIPDTDH